MKKIIGIVLIVLSIFLAYTGITKFSNSGENINIVGIEIDVSNEKTKTSAFLYLGLAALSFVGGVVLVKSNE